MKEEKKKLKEAIRMLRMRSKISQRKFAENLGCSQVTYSNYESGGGDMKYSLLYKIAEYYNMTIVELLESV